MAASGSQTIQLYYSTSSGTAPVAGNLASGELAINITDGKLYYKDNSGVVQTMATKGTALIGGSNTQVQYNNNGTLAGSGNLTFDGTTLTAGGLSGPLNGSVGATTPNTGAFTNLSSSGTVSGIGFSNYLASPPAIGGTTPAAGSFTTLSASGSVTLSGGTANGVLYLNGSKVATSGSALTFNGTVLYTNGKIGVGETNPTALVEARNTSIARMDADSSAVYFGSGNNYPVSFKVNDSEQMRLTSTGLGIGTSSPSYKLDIYSASGTAALQLKTSTNPAWTINSQIPGVSNSGFAIRDESVSTNRLVIDSSGNLGIGTSSPSKKLEVANSDALIYGITVGRGAGAVSSNTAVGSGALAANTTGSQNTAVGRDALVANTTGTLNAAFGDGALQSATTASGNTAIGSGSQLYTTTGASNTSVGRIALLNNTTGSFNTALGREALFNNTTASNNTAVGYQAAYSTTTGEENTAMGWKALFSNTTGQYNSAFGLGSLQLNTTASYNSGSGQQTLYSNTTGASNTAQGYRALFSNTTASNNTAVGYQAGYSNTTGSVTAFGQRALYSNTTGADSVAMGIQALFANTTGNFNTAVGHIALTSNTTGAENVALGARAAESSSTASDITAVGFRAARANTAGTTTAFGAYALDGNTSGLYNTALGMQALAQNTTANSNTAVGYQSLYSNTTGPQGTAVGYQALSSTTTTGYSTAMGYQAAQLTTTGIVAAFGQYVLRNNTTGNANAGFGGYDGSATQTLASNTTGSYNSAFGMGALASNTTADSNTAVGYQAGYSVTTGYGNTFLGREAGQNTTATTTGIRNVIVGAFSRCSAAGGSDQIVLGYNITGQGDSYVTIGSNSGKIYNAYTVNATWTQTSDERLKNIIGADTLGLSFINRLKPIKYTWKASNDIDSSLPYYNEVNQRNTTTVMHGLSAQQVKAALDAEGVTTFAGWDVGPDGIQAISREMFVTPLINAINELTEQVNQLKAELATLKGN